MKRIPGLLLQSSRPSVSQSSSHSHSGTRSFFFFNKPNNSSSPQIILNELQSAQKAGRLDLIPKLYSKLVATTTTTSTGITTTTRKDVQQQVTHDKLTHLMRFVAQTNRFSLLLKMFNDLPLFGYQPDVYDHHTLLMGFVKSNKLSKAIKWIESMKATSDISPRTIDWNIIMGGYRTQGDIEGMKRVIKLMKVLGRGETDPDLFTYNIMISAYLESKDLDNLSEVRKEMEEAGIIPNIVTETALMMGYLDMEEMKSARNARDRLQTLLSTIPMGDQWDSRSVNALIKFKLVEEGYTEGLALVEKFRNKGCRLDQWTMSNLANVGAKEVKTVEASRNLVEELERIVGAESTRYTWSIVIQGALKNGAGVEVALAIYQEARDRSITPDSSMIQPLINALILPSPTAEAFVIVKRLYEDLTVHSKDYRARPDLPLYISLLKACADPIHPDLEFANNLLNDMKDSGMTLEKEMVGWYIIALMRASKSFEEAFKAYDMIRSMDVSLLDESEYNKILVAFTNLRFDLPPPTTSTTASDPDSETTPVRRPRAIPPATAPANIIQEFLTDMRRSDHPPSSTTYTILLNHYSKSYLTSASAISHVHSLIKLDIYVDPDTALFNALMNAYSRTGAYAESFRIWDRLVARTGGVEIDSHSISIVLDTCGFENNLEGFKRGRKIWNRITKEEVSDENRHNRRGGGNLKNWESWIECLCRWGEFEEAFEIVFEQMKDGKNAIEGTHYTVPQLESSTIEILLKFSLREKREGRSSRPAWERVRDRVRDEYSGEIWETTKRLELWNSSGERIKLS